MSRWQRVVLSKMATDWFMIGLRIWKDHKILWFWIWLKDRHDFMRIWTFEKGSDLFSNFGQIQIDSLFLYQIHINIMTSSHYLTQYLAMAGFPLMTYKWICKRIWIGTDPFWMIWEMIWLFSSFTKGSEKGSYDRIKDLWTSLIIVMV